MLTLRLWHRFKKRTIAVVAVVVGLTLLSGVLLALYAARLSGPARLSHIVVTAQNQRQQVLGSGLSVSRILSANWLSDASFEPFHFSHAVALHQGSEATLTASSADTSAGQFGDGFFDQAHARVLGWSESGLVQKKTGRVVSFGLNRVGQFKLVDLPPEWPTGTQLHDFAYRDGITLATGDRGLLLYQSAGSLPQVIDLELSSDLVAVDSYDDGFILISRDGQVWQSADGLDWQLLAATDLRSAIDLALSDDGHYVAVSTEGHILSGSVGQVPYLLRGLSGAGLSTAAWGNGRYVIAGQEGQIFTSTGGLIWQPVLLETEDDWNRVVEHDGTFILAGDKGQVASSDNGKSFQLTRTGQTHDLIDLVMLSSRQIIALDQQSRYHISSDGGRTFIPSTIENELHSRRIALVDRDRLISSGYDGQFGTARLVAEIQLDSALKQGEYQTGDILFLERSALEIPETHLLHDAQDEAGYWQYSGPGLIGKSSDDNAPGGGEAALLIQRDDLPAGDEPSIVSQALPKSLIEQTGRNEIYTFELWLKQDQISHGNVKVWLSGLFEPVGTEFTKVGSTWRKYTYSFVLPVTRAASAEPVQFNIAYEGEGSLWVDRVIFGRTAEKADLFPETADQIVRQAEPSVLRLGFMPIGLTGMAPDSWSLPLGNENTVVLPDGRVSAAAPRSLAAGLQLASAAGADPWIVIDAHVSENELLHLIEYLAGPISEPYGRLRQQSGAILPWTDRFNRLYLEITDLDGIMGPDRLKADFVNLVIETIQRSPYYQAIKQQLVFIDGFTYQDGIMLSSADYHAADLQIPLVRTEEMSAVDLIDNAYDRYISQMPRLPERPGQQLTEMIRSAAWQNAGSQPLSLALLTHFLLADVGQQTAVTNLDIQLDDTMNRLDGRHLQATKLSARLVGGVPLQVRISEQGDSGPDPSSPAQSDPGLIAYGFSRADTMALLILNVSEHPQECLISSDLTWQDADIYKYDAAGLMLDQQTYRRANQRITLLPGGAVLLEKRLTPDN